MGTEQLADNNRFEQEERDLRERKEIQEGLEGLKKEFDRVDVDYKPFDEHEVSVQLLGLTNRIAELLKVEKEQGDIKFIEYHKLRELMHSVMKKVQEGSDLFPERYALDEEKALLLALLNGVLADLGRQEQASSVKILSNEAKNFYTAMGLGSIYAFLLKNANSAEEKFPIHV